VLAVVTLGTAVSLISG